MHLDDHLDVKTSRRVALEPAMLAVLIAGGMGGIALRYSVGEPQEPLTPQPDASEANAQALQHHFPDPQFGLVGESGGAEAGSFQKGGGKGSPIGQEPALATKAGSVMPAHEFGHSIVHGNSPIARPESSVLYSHPKLSVGRNESAQEFCTASKRIGHSCPGQSMGRGGTSHDRADPPIAVGRPCGTGVSSRT